MLGLRQFFAWDFRKQAYCMPIPRSFRIRASRAQWVVQGWGWGDTVMIKYWCFYSNQANAFFPLFSFTLTFAGHQKTSLVNVQSLRIVECNFCNKLIFDQLKLPTSNLHIYTYTEFVQKIWFVVLWIKILTYIERSPVPFYPKSFLNPPALL